MNDERRSQDGLASQGPWWSALSPTAHFICRQGGAADEPPAPLPTPEL